MKTLFQRVVEAFAAANPDRIVWEPNNGWTDLGKRLIPEAPRLSPPTADDDDPHSLDRWHDDGGRC